jgi:drug/metabolite transporter (DMT)-like permease
MKITFLTALTMVAFASNSLLTRLAIDGDHIDPSSFGLIRVLSGALTLWLIVAARRSRLPLAGRARIIGAGSLAAYIVGFSMAYLTLDAGLGALILFGVVQITMFLQGALTEAGPTRRQLVGAAVSFAGLLLALWPGADSTADPVGAGFMILAGVGWGIYTISGRGAADPLASTGANFMLCLPILAILLFATLEHASPTGLGLAIVCGAITSGLGYTLWYSVLPHLQQGAAAIVQLSVPVLAILGGAIFLGEAITPVIILAALLVLGGIAFGVTSRSSRADRR